MLENNNTQKAKNIDIVIRIGALALPLVALPLYLFKFITLSSGGLDWLIGDTIQSSVPTGWFNLLLHNYSDSLVGFDTIELILLRIIGIFVTLAFLLQLAGPILGFSVKKKIAKIANIASLAVALIIMSAVLIFFLSFYTKQGVTASPTASIIFLIILQVFSIAIAVFAFIRFNEPEKKKAAFEMPVKDNGYYGAEDYYMGNYETTDLFSNHAQQRTGSLQFLGGCLSGCLIPVLPGDEIAIGRDARICNVVIDRSNLAISRKHLIVSLDASTDTYVVTDVSSNGTYVVGGQKLSAHQPAYLSRGTTLNLGNTKNTLRLE